MGTLETEPEATGGLGLSAFACRATYHVYEGRDLKFQAMFLMPTPNQGKTRSERVPGVSLLVM